MNHKQLKCENPNRFEELIPVDNLQRIGLYFHDFGNSDSVI
jgi:hypothetical protein